MKFFVSISISALLPYIALSQLANTKQESYWKNLCANLEKKSEVITEFLTLITESKYSDSNLIANAKEVALELKSLVQSNTAHDSATVKVMSKTNFQLTMAIARNLATMESDPDFRNSPEYLKMLKNLRKREKNVSASIDHYNKESTLLNRKFEMFDTHK